MAEQIKDLGGLVNRDFAYSKVKEDILYDSENFRITTDEGGTLAVRTNIKGNTKILEIPDSPAEVELILLEELELNHVYQISFDITNSQTSITSTISITFNYAGIGEFYNAIKTQLMTMVSNPVHALYGADVLLPGNYTKLVIRGYFSTVTNLYMVDTVGPVNVTSKVSVQVARQIQTGLKIIGWCTIRDTIYLLTTNATFNPDTGTGPFISLGQWWRLDYDKSLSPSDPLNYTLKLVYNNEMNVTIERPVANPGMIEGRYENKDVQKIYWTDNFNVPRQINVAPSQDAITAALTVEQLNLIPALNMEPARITGISDGSLYAGVYFVIYRLKNLNNSETRFSRLSSAFPILDANEGLLPVGYYPDKNVNDANGINSNKSIRVQIDNLNTEYSTIEIATIWYKNNYDLPEIRIVQTLSIPANGKIDTFITGNEEKIIITLDEATSFTTAIKRCKTMAAKKQTLFLGNLTIASQKVNYDTRTYRFPANSQYTIIWDASGNSYEIDANDNFKIWKVNGVAVTPYDVPEEHDCIQDYNMQDPGNAGGLVTTFGAIANYLYLPNSTVPGGEGPNLKYVFVTKGDSFSLDTWNNALSNPFAVNGAFYRPSTQQYTSFDPLSSTDTQALTPSYGNYQSPFNYGLYEGYMRDELYRFGVVFYDQLDNPTYVNWTADIRMPHIYMPDVTAGALYTSTGTNPRSTVNYTYPDGEVFNSRPTEYDSATTRLKANPLGIKFTFKTFPNSYYQSGSIVRLERTKADKHILGQGIFRNPYKAASCWGSSGLWLFLDPISVQGNDRDWFYANDGPQYSTSSGEATVWSFHSPETVRFLDPSGNIIPETQISNSGSTDKMEIVSLYDNVDGYWLGWYDSDTSYFPANGGYWDEFQAAGTICGEKKIRYYATYRKHYSFIEDSTTPKVIKGFTAPNGGTDNPYKVVRKYDHDLNFYGSQNSIFTTLTGKQVAPCTPTAYAGNTNRPAWRRGTSCDGQNANPASAGDSNDANHRMSALGRCTVVELDYSNVFNDFNEPSGTRQMLFQDNIWNSNRYYIANYKKAPPLAYAGNTYFARSVNEYVGCGNFVRFSGSSTDTIVFGGDTVIEVFDKITDHYNADEHAAIRQAGYNNSGTASWAPGLVCQYPQSVYNFMRLAFFPVETSIPIGYRRANPQAGGYTATAAYNGHGVPNRISWLAGNNDLGQIASNSIESYEYFGLDPVYIHNSKSIYRYFPFNPSTIPTETFDCRVWRSENKIDGETVESWSIYTAGAFKDVESAYGPLNNLVVFQDKLYFIQDKGFGTLQVDEQKLITDAQGESDLVLGSTGLLERYDYISTKTGTKHQFSMSVSDYSMIWFDTLARKIMRYKPGELQPVSDVRGLNAFLYQETDGIIQTDDNPYIFQGVHSTYDYRFNEFYMTFVQPANLLRDGKTMPPNPFTLVFNELFDGFVGKYTHHPTVYINDKSNIFSIPINLDNPLDSSSMYIHHYGDYGVFYDQAPAQSKISFVINSNPTIEKVLNNLEVSAEVFDVTKELFAQPMMYKFFDRMRVYDNYQNSDFIQLVPGLARKHKTIWNIKVPSDRVLDVTQPIFDSVNLSTVRPSITRRFKDKWFMVELVYDNADNYKLVAHSAKALFTANSR